MEYSKYPGQASSSSSSGQQQQVQLDMSMIGTALKDPGLAGQLLQSPMPIPEYLRRQLEEVVRTGPSEDRRPKVKEYAVPYDRRGHMQLPVKSDMNPYEPSEPAFGGGMPSVVGGNVAWSDGSYEDTLRRETLEEIGKFGFKMEEVEDAPVHAVPRKGRRPGMTFRDMTVRGAFGAKEDEMDQLPPAMRETASIRSIDPSTLGVNRGSSDLEILRAVATACGIDPDGDRRFQPWTGSGTATAIVESLRRRLPQP